MKNLADKIKNGMQNLIAISALAYFVQPSTVYSQESDEGRDLGLIGAGISAIGAAKGNLGASAVGRAFIELGSAMAGRSETKVIVQPAAPSLPQPQSISYGERKPEEARDNLEIVLCKEFKDENGDGIAQDSEIKDPKDYWMADESFNIILRTERRGNNYINMSVIDDNHKPVIEKGFSMMKRFVGGEITPGRLKPGSYTIETYFRGIGDTSVRFSVFPHLKGTFLLPKNTIKFGRDLASDIPIKPGAAISYLFEENGGAYVGYQDGSMPNFLSREQYREVKEMMGLQEFEKKEDEWPDPKSKSDSGLIRF